MHMHMFAYLLTCLLARVLASHDVTPPLLTLTCTLVYSPLPQVVESIFKLQDGREAGVAADMRNALIDQLA